MTPEFLRLYNDELAFLREMGNEFAQAYPRIAGRLGLEAAEAADPHVERLLEGTAFLAARVQMKLHARFPDFTQHLMEIVYPHFLAPIPSMAVVGFDMETDSGRMEKGHVIPRGTKLISQVVAGTISACEFRTAHDVQLWPIEIKAIDYINRADQIASLQLAAGTQAAIRMRLGTTNGMALKKLGLKSLPMYFPPEGGAGGALLQQLLSDCLGIVLRPTERPMPWQERLPASAIRHSFADPSQGLLPRVRQAFDGYRLLQEYFALPERTLFVELTNLADAVQVSDGSELEIVFALRRSDPRLERQLRRDHVRLFATPAINLFERTADRIRIDESRHEYHVVPDRVRPLDLEVHSIIDLRGELAEGDNMPFRPFYSLNDDRPGVMGGFYTVRREGRVMSQRARQYGHRTAYLGGEVFLSIGDPNVAPHRDDLQQLTVRCLCTNRDLPMLMPFGQGATDFTLEVAAPVKAVRCLTTPTRPVTSAAQGDVAWKLVSHLSLNYLSISDTEEGTAAATVRELLSLYVMPDRPDLTRQVQAVNAITTVPAIRRLPGGGLSAVARGVEVTLDLDENGFEGLGAFPLASVLARFFARHASINSFAETVLHTATDGEVARWPAMPGRKATL